MIEAWTDLSIKLADLQVFGSAPTRLDCGGSTDHRLTALLCRHWRPMTVNIAVDLTANVRIGPYKTGKILVNIKEIGQREFTPPRFPFKGPFALVSAIICYFGVHGCSIEICTDFPFQSGLGGSGAVAIALIGAFQECLSRNVLRTEEFPSYVRVAHNLEDSLFGNTGMQDQAAAIYGGVNLWEWRYSDHLNFERRQITTDISELNEHILLAYTGRSHELSQNGSRMLARFRSKGDLGPFIAISKHAQDFANALEFKDHRLAGKSLSKAFQLRSSLLPALPPCDLELLDMAQKLNCGASLTGRGGGGCIWAIGEKQDIAELRSQWQQAFEFRQIGSTLSANVTDKGMVVRSTRIGETDSAAT